MKAFLSSISAGCRGDVRLEQIVEATIAQLQDGQVVDVEVVATTHPEYATQLRELLPIVKSMIHRGATAEKSPNEGPCDFGKEAAESPQTLGDFRILHELGRGGMGVVHEAEQISLGRRVALKVLPFAAMLDKQQLARFKNEARAAATLDHPNIVAIYSVGAERGVHYYAMQLIEGRSLAEFIAAMKLGRSSSPEDPAPRAVLDPKPTANDTAKVALPTVRASGSAAFSTIPPFDSREYFRAIARLGIQAAEALDHAHQSGILHRDIKPANLLVDDAGKLWITDFGLARIEADAGITVTGDLLGTLRYMSPEQALAKRAVVDHRSDIYSLGITLYELLTLHHAYAAEDRQDLLRQIAFDEPLKPRQLNRDIPPDLETIVLKAISKGASDRYTTAMDLAEDIRRFVLDQPIRARQPSVAARARKWSRRHASVLTTAAGAALIGLAIAAGAIGWAIRDRQARFASTEKELGSALEEAKDFSKQANWTSALAAIRRAESLVAGGSASVETAGAVQQLRRDNDMASRLESICLDHAALCRADGDLDTEGAIPEYATAFRDYGIDVEQLPHREAVDRIRASAISEQLCFALDEWTRSLCSQGEARLPALALVAIANEADGDKWRMKLRAIGVSPREEAQKRAAEFAAEVEGHSLPAETAMRFANYLHVIGDEAKAEAQYQSVYSRAPSNFRVLLYLGKDYLDATPQRLDEAIRFLSAAVAVRPDSPVALNNLGLALGYRGRLQEAVDCLREALRIKPDLASAHNNLAMALAQANQPDEAVIHYREAVRHWPDRGTACCNFGDFLLERGELEEAYACYEEAVKREPKLARAHHKLGNYLFKTNQLDAAIDSYREAVRLKGRSGDLHNALGVALARKRLYEEAIESYRVAVELDPKVAQVHCNLAEAYRSTGAEDDAIASFRETIQLDPDCLQAYNRLGNIYTSRSDWVKAADNFRNAVRLRPTDAMLQFKLGNSLFKARAFDEAIVPLAEAVRLKPDTGSAHDALASALCRTGKLGEAIAHYEEALRLIPNSAVVASNLGVALHQNGDLEGAIMRHKQAVRLNPKYTNAHYNLACALRDRGDFSDAVESFENAIHSNPEYRRALTDCAWLLATCSDKTLQNPARAIELATRITKLDSSGQSGWSELGAAHYRNGDWVDARAALSKAIEHGSDSEPRTLLLLAMALWQLQEHDTARTTYDRAVTQIKDDGSAAKEVSQLLNEAVELIRSSKPPVTEESKAMP